VLAAKEVGLHFPLTKGLDLVYSLCIKKNRVARNDNASSLNGNRFQIQEPAGVYFVEIQERLNNALLIKSQRQKP